MDFRSDASATLDRFRESAKIVGLARIAGPLKSRRRKRPAQRATVFVSTPPLFGRRNVAWTTARRAMPRPCPLPRLETRLISVNLARDERPFQGDGRSARGRLRKPTSVAEGGKTPLGWRVERKLHCQPDEDPRSNPHPFRSEWYTGVWLCITRRAVTALAKFLQFRGAMHRGSLTCRRRNIVLIAL